MAESKPIEKMTKPELVEFIHNQSGGQPAYGWAAGLDYDAGIYERLIGIGSDVGAMQKQRVQNFKAFAVDDVYSKLRPLFTKWGVAILPNIRSVEYVEREEPKTDSRGTGTRTVVDARVVIEYRFVAPDGSTASIAACAEGRDYSDKATNKAIQQAFKYGLIQMFMISTGEVEPDAENIEVASASPVEVGQKLSAGEKRLKEVKDYAWQHTADMDDRINETRSLVEQVISVYGREPKDAADVDAMKANIDEIFSEPMVGGTDPTNGTG